MILTDYFLKFASRDRARQVFSSIREHTYEGEIVQQTETFAIDEVGILYNDDAVFSNGEITTPPTQIEGYHYNYRIVYRNKSEIPLPTELEPYLVAPETPQRTFF
jgi:hypothetical protein